MLSQFFLSLLVIALPLLSAVEWQNQNYTGVIVCMNAASFSQPTVARGSIVAIFGRDLAPNTETPPTPQNSVLGVTVGVQWERFVFPAELIFVSPGQVNIVLPAGITGVALVHLRNAEGQHQVGYIEIVDSAPGLFTFQVDGRPIAQAVGRDGSSVVCDESGCRAVPLPQDPTGRFKIIFYGTGFRNCPPDDLRLSIDGNNGRPFNRFPLTEGPGVDLIVLSPASDNWTGWHTVQCRCGDQVSNLAYFLGE